MEKTGNFYPKCQALKMENKFDKDLSISQILKLNMKIGANNKTGKSQNFIAKLEVNGLRSVNIYQEDLKTKSKIDSIPSSKRTMTSNSKNLKILIPKIKKSKQKIKINTKDPV